MTQKLPTVATIVSGDWNSVVSFSKDVQRNLQKLTSIIFGPAAMPTFGGLTLTGALTLSGLTASKLVGTDADKVLQSISTGTSLSLSGATLNTIQDIRTTDTPQFAGLGIGVAFSKQTNGILMKYSETVKYGLVLGQDGYVQSANAYYDGTWRYFASSLGASQLSSWCNATQGRFLIQCAGPGTADAAISFAGVFSGNQSGCEYLDMANSGTIQMLTGTGPTLTFDDTLDQLKLTGATFRVPAMSSAGYVKNDASGVLSGGNTVDPTGVNHAGLSNLTYATAGHTGFEPTVTKGNLTAGSSKITIGGTGTGAVIGAGASVDVAESNLTHNNLSGLQGGAVGEYSHLTNAQITALHAQSHASTHISTGGDPVDHNTLTNYSANKHIDHTAVSILAGTGMSGGGDISANRTLTCTISQYTDALARAAISETITGFDYSSVTGVFSLTTGYVIPTTTEETNWNAAYTHVSNNGTDHSYINQSVTTSASPQFVGLTLTGNLTLPEDGWVGIGAAAERIVFDGSGNKLVFKVTNTGTLEFGGESVAGATTLVFSEGNQNYDLHLSNNTGYFRLFATDALAAASTGAAIQFFGNSVGFGNGCLYIDTGCINDAAIIFRSGRTGGNIGQRMMVASTATSYLVNIGSGTFTSYIDEGAELDLIADGSGGANIFIGNFISNPADATGVGAINFHANQSGAHRRLAYIACSTSGTTAGQRGGDLIFHTKPDASTSYTERMRIDQTGLVTIAGVCRANGGFSDGATAGIDDSAAGTVVDVHASGGLVTAITRVTPVADGTYNFATSSGKVASMTITNGVVTGITVTP